MRVKLGSELAPYFVLFTCVATLIRAISAARGPIKSVMIVLKEIYSVHVIYTRHHNTAASYDVV